MCLTTSTSYSKYDASVRVMTKTQVPELRAQSVPITPESASSVQISIYKEPYVNKHERAEQYIFI